VSAVDDRTGARQDRLVRWAKRERGGILDTTDDAGVWGRAVEGLRLVFRRHLRTGGDKKHYTSSVRAVGVLTGHDAGSAEGGCVFGNASTSIRPREGGRK